MTLLLFCMTIMRAPTMPSPDSGGVGGAASGVSVTFNRTRKRAFEHQSLLRMSKQCCNHDALQLHSQDLREKEVDLHFGASSPLGSDPAELLCCLLLQRMERQVVVVVGHWREEEVGGNLKK